MDTLYLVFKDRFRFNESDLVDSRLAFVALQTSFYRPKQNVILTESRPIVKRFLFIPENYFQG